MRGDVSDGPALERAMAGCGTAYYLVHSMVAAGATPIDQEPRPGSRGTTVAFIHPKGALGTLIELVEE